MVIVEEFGGVKVYISKLLIVDFVYDNDIEVLS